MKLYLNAFILWGTGSLFVSSMLYKMTPLTLVFRGIKLIHFGYWAIAFLAIILPLIALYLYLKSLQPKTAPASDDIDIAFLSPMQVEAQVAEPASDITLQMISLAIAIGLGISSGILLILAGV